MGSINFTLLFDLFLTIYGAYLLLSGVKMKRTGEPSNMVLQQDETYQCKDKMGFVDAIYKKMIVFGVVTTAYGVFGTLNNIYINNVMLNVAGLGLFLLVCFWFISQLHHVRDEFLK